jgi:hypothetical protein
MTMRSTSRMAGQRWSGLYRGHNRYRPHMWSVRTPALAVAPIGVTGRAFGTTRR